MVGSFITFIHLHTLVDFSSASTSSGASPRFLRAHFALLAKWTISIPGVFNVRNKAPGPDKLPLRIRHFLRPVWRSMKLWTHPSSIFSSGKLVKLLVTATNTGIRCDGTTTAETVETMRGFHLGSFWENGGFRGTIPTTWMMCFVDFEVQTLKLPKSGWSEPKKNNHQNM